jgi:hypothetical protein
MNSHQYMAVTFLARSHSYYSKSIPGGSVRKVNLLIFYECVFRNH